MHSIFQINSDTFLTVQLILLEVVYKAKIHIAIFLVRPVQTLLDCTHTKGSGKAYSI